MVEKRKSEIDIVNEVLEACLLAYPVSSFVISLYKQYLERGSLSKKQLQGLFGKAQQIEDFPAGKLATLEARIKKMPTRYKSEAPTTNKPLYEKEETTGAWIEAVLSKYPQHKQVLFLQAKYNNNEVLSTTELADLKRFYGVVSKK
jgi:hypothetical protein